MAKIFSVVSKAGLARIVNPVAAALLRVGITPNAVTVAGTVGVLIGSVGFATRGHMVIALVIVTVSCLTDMLDGAMARQLGVSNKFGALLDSAMDRVSDGAIFGSVAFWFASQGQLRECAAALLCLLTGQVVSYVKARAEGLGMTANVGLAERTERLILVGIGGLLFGFDVKYGMESALWLLVLLSLITIGQRTAHVYRQARDIAAAQDAAAGDRVAP
ncbi:phosphatidylinositol phosphate synthase [Dactylosporangium sp. NPDC005555]|uniref:phosphatidylinositol phosphate synthase n=1 Tax=Dactylosporangium sp. NPDC005555 TaxID=3154889 RepID=UPI0033BAD7D5